MRNRDCAVLVDFLILPRLFRLTISYLQFGRLIFHGKSESLKILEIIQLKNKLSDKLSNILRKIRVGLKQIIVNNSWGTYRVLNIELFFLKKIHLLRSPGFLPFLLLNKFPALKEIIWKCSVWGVFCLSEELKAIRSNFPNNKNNWASIMQLTNSNRYLILFIDLARRYLIDCFEHIKD